jgi:hypothetical protein
VEVVAEDMAVLSFASQYFHGLSSWEDFLEMASLGWAADSKKLMVRLVLPKWRLSLHPLSGLGRDSLSSTSLEKVPQRDAFGVGRDGCICFGLVTVDWFALELDEG